MFQSFFNGLSGLFSFSRSLDNVSNNVSNMNTPGYRGSDTLFRSVAGGYGSQVEGESVRLFHGDLRQTGNPTDLALNGSGFFILRDDAGEQFYTRAGQFRFDEDGILVDTATGYRVAGMDAAGNLIDISIAELRTLPPEATTSVDIVGNLNSAAAAHTIEDIIVHDHQGQTHSLNAVFTNNDAVTPDSWLVDITDEGGAVIGTGELRFNADGSPMTGFNTITATLTAAGEDNDIAFSFGTAAGFSGTTQFSGTQTTVGAQVQDGHAVAGLTTVEFDESGVLQLTYGDGEEQSGPQIALAFFNDEARLQLSGGNMFRAADVSGRELGRPGEGVFGNVAGGSIELSNVDLTQEFADMIILQRGYQASSRVLSVANELLEQLYNSTRRG